MDPTVDNQPQESPVAQLDGVIVSKRQMENVEKEELPRKRLKNGGGDDMRRVAEIVLVLSALAGMRGGKKSPTDAEVELMEEARGKLVEICKDLAPKDLVGRDSIGNIIEDLGLNSKLKDQRLGFRGSRLSVKEKFLLSKRKMEDSKKFAVPSASYTSPMTQPSLGAIPETRGPSQIIRILPPDRSSKAPLPSGGFPASFPASHVSAATPASATHQPLTTDARASTVSAGLPNNLKGRDLASVLYPKVEKPQYKLEVGSNGAAYAPQVPANPANASAIHPSVNASTWSVQPHSASLGKSAPENKAPNHNSAKVEGTADSGLTRATPQAARDQIFRPFIPQTASANVPSAHPPMQGLKHGQPYNNHNEIAKMVQRLLNPKLPEHPTWTPPSREYMNKALTCQICKFLVNEVETVVICDACETGFHLKCLEGANQKGIPRGEWHCMKCMTLSNGKALPPKYGRVMRSITQPKGPINPAGTQVSSEKKPGTVDSKVNQEKITANQSSGSQNTAGSGTVSGNNVQSASDSRIPSESEIPTNGMTSGGKDADRVTCSGTFPNNSTERSIQQAQVSELSIQDERTLSESELQFSALSINKISNNCEDSEPLHTAQVVAQTELSNSVKAPLLTHQDHSIMKESVNITRNSDNSSRFEVKKTQQDAANTYPVGHSEPNNAAEEHPCLSSDGFHGVEWIGNVTKAADGKTFYESCCVKGVTYKVHDHALFNSSHGKLMPFKLQAMWEDTETGSKWVLVSQCYIPGDLPKAVGHPCAPESNEVYESNHEINVMAGLIEGPCEVLPPIKFKEKLERQNELAAEANSGSPPVFICKWFFDELKGNFQPVFN